MRPKFVSMILVRGTNFDNDLQKNIVNISKVNFIFRVPLLASGPDFFLYSQIEWANTNLFKAVTVGSRSKGSQAYEDDEEWGDEYEEHAVSVDLQQNLYGEDFHFRAFTVMRDTRTSDFTLPLVLDLTPQAQITRTRGPGFSP